MTTGAMTASRHRHPGRRHGWSAFCGTGQVLGAVPAILDKWTFVAVVYDQVAQTVKLRVDDMVLTKTGVTGPGAKPVSSAPIPFFQRNFHRGHR